MAKVDANRKIRESIVGGLFYPEDPACLKSRIKGLLEKADPPFSAARAILAPHACLDYSGDLAALAWKSATASRVDCVVIVAPHHRSEDERIYLPESESYRTSLGTVSVDMGRVRELLDCGTMFSQDDIPHLEEHGIELQLIFMQTLFPDALLVPIIIGRPRRALVKTLASALDIVFGGSKETLFVLSSNLAACIAEDRAERSTRAFLDSLGMKDWKSVLEYSSDPALSICGAGCAASFLASRTGAALEPVLLGHHSSAAFRPSPEERLVQYAAVAFREAAS